MSNLIGAKIAARRRHRTQTDTTDEAVLLENIAKGWRDARDVLVGHCFLFLMGNAFLILIWYFVGGFFWPIIVIGLWGIALLVHWILFTNFYGFNRASYMQQVLDELRK